MGEFERFRFVLFLPSPSSSPIPSFPFLASLLETHSLTLFSSFVSFSSQRVEMAVKEIKRLLIEGTILGLAHEQRNPTAGGGRYKID